ncbi:hypothetical protein GE09DRAFT_1062744 [Coniochaeta sp. 2T2.1]|nr:hypothetical protein GE09DRAFT_1062744 [Coniochaeta sp. 2T2.1]
MIASLLPNALLLLLAVPTLALNFTIAGGQIFTPGLAVLDAPQPGTPLGGETIEVALDVSANGRLSLPPYPDDSPTKIHNITIFLYSYATGKNFTITNGTVTANNASLGDIMVSEPGSTVKHVKWMWPDCLVGDGQPTTVGSARGVYNISIRQNFRLNGDDHYTIFDVPISVTNKIDFGLLRPTCDSLNNPLLTPEEIDIAGANDVPVLFAPGDSTQVQTSGGDASGDSLGPSKQPATPGQGLGNAGSAFDWRAGAYWIPLVGILVSILPRILHAQLATTTPLRLSSFLGHASRHATMPLHSSLLPREGFTADVLFRLLGRTAFNPALLLPLLLLARFTKKGEDLSILHPLAYSRLRKIFYLSLARWLNNVHSRRVVNNRCRDVYHWHREVAVVTGGSGGIGGHVAQLLAEQGCKVVVLDIQPLTYAASKNVHFYACDITSPATLRDVAERIRKEVGTPTILINNAGVARGKTILDSSERDVRFTFDVNALSHYWTVKEFLPDMVASNHGMVVTVASFASWVTAPNMVDYGASKAAAQAFHEGLAAELVTRYAAPKVRTVLVNQGYTRTALFEGYANESRFVAPTLHPETVADAIVRQVLKGESGQVVVPGLGNLISGLAGWPLWLQHGLRAKYQSLMVGFKGRQVVEDLEGFYEKREREERERREKEGEKGKGTEESAVLVPK